MFLALKLLNQSCVSLKKLDFGLLVEAKHVYHDLDKVVT